MKNRTKIIIAILALSSGLGFAQQESLITQYWDHLNFFNPAATGVGGSKATFTMREQWSQIAESPVTQMVSFGTQSGNRVGLGFSIMGDKTFVESQTMVGVDFSYHLPMSEDLNLYLGLKASGNFYNINTSGLETYDVMSDPAINSINNFMPNVGMGAYLTYKSWYASLSAPKLLDTKRAKEKDGVVSAATDKTHFYAVVGYDLPLNSIGGLISNENMRLTPSVLLRYVAGAPASADMNAMLHLSQAIGFGATYRTSGAQAAIVQLTLKNLKLGYVYETSTTNGIADAGQTNEISLQYRFN